VSVTSVQVTEQPWAVEVEEITQTVLVSIPGPVMGGANTSITSLGGITGAIQTPTFIDFATGATVPDATARVTWNDATGTLQVGMTGNVQADIGQTLYAFVHNAEGATISKGQPVYLYQATGNKASVKLAYNTSDAHSAKTLGLAAETATAGSNFMVICQGVLDGINTSAYSEGATLYLGATAGSLTSSKPSAPNHLVYIGVVERANAGNGQIYVRPQNGYELEELHNVQIVTPSNGQTILYDASTGLWKNANLTAGAGITITNGAGSVTIAATGGGTGTVTSVDVSGGTTGLTTSGGPITGAGTITLAGTLAVANGGTGAATLTGIVKGNGTSAFTAASAGTDYLAPFGSQTQAYVYAAPSGSAGVPSFRALVASDIPTLNQNTTGTASNVTGTVAIANGGSGQTSAQAAINAFAGAVTSGQYLRGNGTNVVMSAIQAADVPTLNQNTTGTAANVTGTVAIANGGSGQTSAQAAINAFAGSVTSGQFLRGNGTNVVMSAIQAADVPTLNQNTTGTAANVTGTVAIANGGSGQTSAQAAMNAFAGAVTSGQYLRGNGTNVVMAAIQAADVPTLNQNTTGTAANVTGTVAVANGGTGATDAATARSNLTAQKTITSGTAAPTGGSDGDIYLQYT
jgi:hypothetical protein